MKATLVLGSLELSKTTGGVGHCKRSVSQEWSVLKMEQKQKKKDESHTAATERTASAR
jgi:hypothetical protein